jgi:hypothetical protein
VAKSDSDIDDWIFRQYVAYSLQAIPENKKLSATLDELVHPKPVDNRTVEEITEDICKRAGITMKRNK